MKKLVLIAALTFSSSAFAGELSSYNDVKSAITTGKTIHIVTELGKCETPGNRRPVPTHIGVFTPTEFLISDHIATSLSHLTMNNPRYRDMPVFEFVSYRITEDNHVNVAAHILHPDNYASAFEKTSFDCKLGEGAKIYD